MIDTEMKEEDIDIRIERVVESVGSKKAAMGQWESERVSNEFQRKVATKRWRTYGISAAASVVVIFGVGVGIYFNNDRATEQGITTSAPVFRGGANDIESIQQLIDSGEYESAIASINNLISDTIIDSSLSPERQEYKRSLYRNQEYELTWMKITALHEMGRDDEVADILKSYLKLEGVHQSDAKEMFKEITK